MLEIAALVHSGFLPLGILRVDRGSTVHVTMEHVIALLRPQYACFFEYVASAIGGF